jgi:hypothetical protein
MIMKKKLLLLLFIFAVMQPNLFAQQVTLTSSKTTIAENENTTITGTLDETSTEDVRVPIVVSGKAALNVDYTSSFPSKGEESLFATISGSISKYVQLSDGRYVFSSGNSLIIYDPITSKS